eukprot:4255790-Pyramimonas_sp.AAC.1
MAVRKHSPPPFFRSHVAQGLSAASSGRSRGAGWQAQRRGPSEPPTMPLESVFGDGAAGAGEFVCSCKWCKRDQNTPQPLNHLKERNPFLCWRRQGGRECSICPNMIAADPDYKNMNRQVLLDSVTPGHESYSEENQKALDGKLAKYESDRNTNGGRVRATPSGRQTVQARSTAMTESRKFVGYLWPTAYWSENNGGAKPDRKQLGSTKHQGRQETNSICNIQFLPKPAAR